MREIKKTPSIAVKLDTEYNAAKTQASPDSFKVKLANEYEHKITVRISSLLLDSLKNIIISNKAGGNFEYTNVSDLIRKALEEYKDGMTLITQRAKDQKRETSFRVPEELHNFYHNLPGNAKSEIMERAISTYVKHKM